MLVLETLLIIPSLKGRYVRQPKRTRKQGFILLQTAPPRPYTRRSQCLRTVFIYLPPVHLLHSVSPLPLLSLRPPPPSPPKSRSPKISFSRTSPEESAPPACYLHVSP